MKIIDMHCDTISELADRGGELWKNSGHLDLKRMQESGYLLQNFALFVDIGKCTPTPWERVCALYEVYRTELEKNKNRIVPVNPKTLCIKERTVAAMLEHRPHFLQTRCRSCSFLRLQPQP